MFYIYIDMDIDWLTDWVSESSDVIDEWRDEQQPASQPTNHNNNNNNSNEEEKKKNWRWLTIIFFRALCVCLPIVRGGTHCEAALGCSGRVRIWSEAQLSSWPSLSRVQCNGFRVFHSAAGGRQRTSLSRSFWLGCHSLGECELAEGITSQWLLHSGPAIRIGNVCLHSVLKA